MTKEQVMEPLVKFHASINVKGQLVVPAKDREIFLELYKNIIPKGKKREKPFLFNDNPPPTLTNDNLLSTTTLLNLCWNNYSLSSQTLNLLLKET